MKLPRRPLREKPSGGNVSSRADLLLAVAFWIVLLATLAPGDAGARSPGVPDPMHACTLLPVSEVTALVGASVDDPVETHKEFKSSRSWMSMCNFYSAQKQISMGVTLKPHGHAKGGAEAFAAHEVEMKEALGQTNRLERLAGIGDQAGWDDSTKQLTVFQGPLMVIVGVVSPKLSAAPALELCKKIAAKVLPQLPLK